jgi:hypothetical protein
MNPEGGGFGVTGDMRYEAGFEATMTTLARDAYTFINWTENGIPAGSNPTQTTNKIKMDRDHTLTANFALKQKKKGKWADQVNRAVPVNRWDEKSGMFMWDGGSILQSGTYYFLIDPKGTGREYSQSFIQIGCRDTEQGQTMNIAYPTVYKVDADGNELATYGGFGQGDYGVLVQGFTKDDYDKGIIFLLEIVEKGMGSGSLSSIYWR